MQILAIFILLAAAAAHASPLTRRQIIGDIGDVSVTVRVSNQQGLFEEVGIAAAPQGTFGGFDIPLPTNAPQFEFVELILGNGFFPQALRCQVRDENNVPLLLARNGEVDTTFADLGRGAWTFADGLRTVSRVECSPRFVRGGI